MSAAGLGLLVLLLPSAAEGIRGAPGPFLVLGTLVVAGELFPIVLPRRQDAEEITTSTTFGFALMLGWGTGPAALALAAAAVTADLRRKPLWKVVFNVAQYTLSIGAAGRIYANLGGSPALVDRDLPALVGAAVGFFVVNTAIIEIALALSQGLRPLHYLIPNLAFQAVTSTTLLALAPVVVVLEQRSVFIVPVLALPVAAVYWGARTAVENAQLAQLNRVKDDLIAVVSHELRTPLTSIQGFVKTLLQIGDQLEPAEQRELLQRAVRQTDRLRGLIEELLAAAHADARPEPAALARVQVPRVMAQVAEEFRARVEDHRLAVEVDPALPPIMSDEGKIRQILSNLLDNAFKYSPAGTTVILRARSGGAGVIVSVEDEGPGIPLEDRGRVFDRFYQADQSRTRAAGGVGLGLYICKRAAAAIGAEVRLERSQGRGAVFALHLPPSPGRAAEGAEALPHDRLAVPG